MTVDVTSYQDAFAYFDKVKWFPQYLLFKSLVFQASSGNISTKLLGQLLRFVGENPSDSEVQVRKKFWNYFTTNFLIFLVSGDVCPRPNSADNEIFCRSVQCVFLWQDLMNEVDTASVGSFNFPNFLNMMLRLSIDKTDFKSFNF